MSNARRALTGATILLMSAALLAALVACSTHAASSTRAATAAISTPSTDTDDDVTPTNTPLSADTSTDAAVATATLTSTPVPSTTSAPSTPTTTSTASAPTTASTTTTTSITATPGGGHAIQTVFIILMENHNWSSIQGNTSEAPYLNSLLSGAGSSQTSYATQYYNPPGLHPSLPNYLWLEGGQCYSYCGTDNPPSASPGGIGSTQHLVTMLDKAGISWKAYEEGISDGSCPLSDNYPYAPKHDPFVYFNDVQAACAAHVKSYADLAGDLRSTTTTARYNFITPNLCDDMHDSCAPTNDAIKQGDTWLANNVPTILNSPAYKNGGALFITWDEGEGGDGPIGLLVLSPYARGHGYHNAVHYTHSSTLRSLEEIFGVSPYLGGAQNATDLSDLFARFP